MRRNDRQIEDREGIESVISAADVCRVAFADNNIPYIVTLNFGYSGGENPCFYFHCAREGRKLDFIRKNNYVCFELDTDHFLFGGEEGCDWGMKYSSVVGYGRMEVVADHYSRIAGLDHIMAHYSDGNKFTYNEKVFESTVILRLEIEEMTGKKKQ